MAPSDPKPCTQCGMPLPTRRIDTGKPGFLRTFAALLLLEPIFWIGDAVLSGTLAFSPGVVATVTVLLVCAALIMRTWRGRSRRACPSCGEPID